MARENRYLVALKEEGNLAGIAVAVALSAATLNPLPLLGGLVIEAAYLLLVPDSKWYAARLSRKYDAEVVKRRQALKDRILPTVDIELQERFARLEQIREQMDSKSQSNATWFRDVLRKLDYLMEKFLVFSEKDVEFRQYIAAVWNQECGDGRRGKNSAATSLPPSGAKAVRMVAEVQSTYTAGIAAIQKTWNAETDLNARGILEKRIEVLKQRGDGIGKIGRLLTNLEHQMGLLEDTFGLINDQIHARSPEQVLSDIEAVIYQTDSMTQLLEEMAPYERVDRD